MLKFLLRDWKNSMLILLNISMGLSMSLTAYVLIENKILEPLQVSEPEQVYHISNSVPGGKFSYSFYDDFKASSHSFSGIVSYEYIYDQRVDFGDKALILDGMVVSPDFFSVLGIKTTIGRAPDADGELSDQVALVSHKLWKANLNGDSSILGKDLIINEKPYKIIGVLGEGFTGIDRNKNSDIWLFSKQYVPKWRLTNRSYVSVNLLGRLAPDSNRHSAEIEINSIGKRLREINPDTDDGISYSLLTESELNFSKNKRSVIQYSALQILSLSLLLVAIYNVVIMSYVRTEKQQNELATRLALGSSYKDLIRGIISPVLVVFTISIIISIFIAYFWLTLLSTHVIKIDFDFFSDLLNLRIFYFSILILSVLILATIIPLRQFARRLDLGQLLKGKFSSKEVSNLLIWAVVFQITVSVVYVTLSCVYCFSFLSNWSHDPGYKGNELVILNFKFNHHSKFTREERIGLCRIMQEKFENIPGVTTAGWANRSPLSGSGWSKVAANGHVSNEAEDKCLVNWLQVGPEFFKSIDIPVLDGRAFQYTDLGLGFSDVGVIVNQAFADRFWEGDSPVGYDFHPWGRDMPQQRIVGLVGNFKTEVSDEVRPAVFTPCDGNRIVWYIRTSIDPNTVMQEVDAVVHQLLPDLPMYTLSSYRESTRRNLNRLIEVSLVSISLGFAGLVIASIGLISTSYQWIVRHQKDIAIRCALGARSRDIFTLVMKKNMRMAIAGIGFGLVLSIGSNHVLSKLVDEIIEIDLTIVCVSVFIVCMANLVTSLWPAWLASRNVEIKSIIDN